MDVTGSAFTIRKSDKARGSGPMYLKNKVELQEPTSTNYYKNSLTYHPSNVLDETKNTHFCLESNT